jgi:spore coat polysaccharide biosynthesis protein SpsF (cytidylyltransferase family)
MSNFALKARVRCVNKANQYANELYPRLVEFFKPYVGTKIETAEGQLLRKIKEKLKTLNLPNTVALQIYQLSSRYALAFVVKTCEVLNGESNYYETTVYVGKMDHGVLAAIEERHGSARTDYKAEEVIAARQAYAIAKAAVSEAHGRLFPFGEYDR